MKHFLELRKCIHANPISHSFPQTALNEILHRHAQLGFPRESQLHFGDDILQFVFASAAPWHFSVDELIDGDSQRPYV
jgi:hypothetical protein